MRLALKEKGVALEPRYDAETLRKVTALAARLQSQKQETLTRGEMEAIGAEVGVDPTFVRQALQTVGAGQAKSIRQGAPTRQTLSIIATYICMPLVGVLLYLFPGYQGYVMTAALLLTTGVGALWDALIQKGVNRKVTMWWLGTACIAGLILVLGELSGANPTAMSLVTGFGVIPLMICVGRLLGISGWQFRRRNALSRATLLARLFELQRELEGQKQHCTFLSVDVVSSSAMKRSAPSWR
jgi:hypothetical protein